MGNVFCIPEVNKIVNNSINITSQFDWYLDRHPDFQRCENTDQIAGWFLTEIIRTNITVAIFEYPTSKVNAFALPGGPIFLTTGLLDLYRNGTISNDEMAFVLAHEFYSSARRHGFSQRSKVSPLVFFLRQYPSSLEIRQPMDQRRRPNRRCCYCHYYLSGVSQDDELYADSIATKENMAMGYNPRAGQSLLQKISGDPKVTGVQEIDNRCYFKTHPDISDRVNNIEEIASTEDTTLSQYFPPTTKQNIITFSSPPVAPQQQTQPPIQQTVVYNTPLLPPPGSTNTISENKMLSQTKMQTTTLLHS
jgi:hypothetical protein